LHGRDAGNLFIIGVEGDDFRAVVQRYGGNQQIERAGGNSFPPARLSQKCGLCPKVWRSGERWQCLKLLRQLPDLRRGGMPQDFKGDRLSQMSVRM
jgi:hypothetical protein